MAYKYYPVYLDKLAKSPKNDWIDDAQALVDDQFYDSSDWYTIQEETSFASGEYQDIDVRINHVVSTTTGANRGDDWKKILFKDLSKSIQVGAMFIFDSNYWIVVNTDSLSTTGSVCTVRRCNNTLRWIDNAGAKHSVPCVLDYSIQENRDYASATSKVVSPSGLLEIISQLNTITNSIKSSTRFLFGNPDNWTAYRVQGGGIHNFLNPTTETFSTMGILKLTLGVTQINESVDDLVNGYANQTENNYTISLNNSSITGSIGETYQLEAIVYEGGVIVSRDVEWSSDDSLVATVGVSGLVTFISDGTATITVSLDGDSAVLDTCDALVDGTPISEYYVDVSPESNNILEGDTQVYAVTLELNGATQVDTFTFSDVSPSSISDKYIFTSIDGNSFSIENVEKSPSGDVIVRAVSGVHTKDITIKLSGAW
jgi:hypothetical protein